MNVSPHDWRQHVAFVSYHFSTPLPAVEAMYFDDVIAWVQEFHRMRGSNA